MADSTDRRLVLPASGRPGTRASALLDSLTLGSEATFELQERAVSLKGYQLYGVEQWIVERERKVLTVTVFTGDERNEISVDILRPRSTLSSEEAAQVFSSTVNLLRGDGARPKQASVACLEILRTNFLLTVNGTLLVTSLGYFRSDLNIVLIPGGSLPETLDDLYVNIDLRRIGCSGRSSLSLAKPSEAQRDRFFATYHILPPSVSSTHSSNPTGTATKEHGLVKDPTPNFDGPVVQATLSSTSQRDSAIAPPAPSASEAVAEPRDGLSHCVLELIRLIQLSLSVFGVFRESNADGLLCDATVDAIGRWTAEIGEEVFDMEPADMLLDPATVASLLSLVCGLRLRLAVLGFQQSSKDVTIEPKSFFSAIAAFQKAQHAGTGVRTLSFTSPPSSAGTSAAGGTLDQRFDLNLVQRVFEAYAARQGGRLALVDNLKIHRVLLSKIDDLSATGRANINLRSDPNAGFNLHGLPGSHHHHGKDVELETISIEAFAKMAQSGTVHAMPEAIRALWTGKLRKDAEGRHILEAAGMRESDRTRLRLEREREGIAPGAGNQGGEGAGVEPREGGGLGKQGRHFLKGVGERTTRTRRAVKEGVTGLIRRAQDSSSDSEEHSDDDVPRQPPKNVPSLLLSSADAADDEGAHGEPTPRLSRHGSPVPSAQSSTTNLAGSTPTPTRERFLPFFMTRTGAGPISNSLSAGGVGSAVGAMFKPLLNAGGELISRPGSTGPYPGPTAGAGAGGEDKASGGLMGGLMAYRRPDLRRVVSDNGMPVSHHPAPSHEPVDGLDPLGGSNALGIARPASTAPPEKESFLADGEDGLHDVGRRSLTRMRRRWSFSTCDEMREVVKVADRRKMQADIELHMTYLELLKREKRLQQNAADLESLSDSWSEAFRSLVQAFLNRRSEVFRLEAEVNELSRAAALIVGADEEVEDGGSPANAMPSSSEALSHPVSRPRSASVSRTMRNSTAGGIGWEGPVSRSRSNSQARNDGNAGEGGVPEKGREQDDKFTLRALDTGSARLRYGLVVLEDKLRDVDDFVRGVQSRLESFGLHVDGEPDPDVESGASEWHGKAETGKAEGEREGGGGGGGGGMRALDGRETKRMVREMVREGSSVFDKPGARPQGSGGGSKLTGWVDGLRRWLAGW